MAKAGARVHAPAARTNVLPFVRPAAVQAPKAPRRGSKHSGRNVLPFTGSKRFVYDRAEVLEKWQTPMEDKARKLLVDVVRGKVTGFMIVTTSGGPGDGCDWVVGGVLCEDLDYSAQALCAAAEWVTCLDQAMVGPR